MSPISIKALIIALIVPKLPQIPILTFFIYKNRKKSLTITKEFDFNLFPQKS